MKRYFATLLLAATGIVGCSDAKVTSCDAGRACPNGQVCVDGACLDSCNSELDCNENEVCRNGVCQVMGQCSQNSDCLDPGSCEADGVCVDGLCEYGVAPAGTPCDDLNACTDHSECDTSGACIGSQPVTCNAPPANVCTASNNAVTVFSPSGVCDPSTGCQYAGTDRPCMNCDQNPNCLNFLCAGVTCTHLDNGCRDGLTCDPNTGSCQFATLANGTSCTQNTANDSVCYNGECVECYQESDCTDYPGHEACFAATCNNNQCVYTQLAASTVCESATCSAAGHTPAALCGASGLCETPPTQSCDDGDSCTTDTCSLSLGCGHENECACIDNSGCPPSNDCQTGECINNECVYTHNTNPCDDGLACTSNDTCNGAGECIGQAITCDDGNVCTQTACNPENIDPGTGLGTCEVVQYTTSSCDDGDACTNGDICDGAGNCGGNAINCDDGNVCTQSACNPNNIDPSTGLGTCEVVLNTTSVCDDGNPCTINDACENGTCAPNPDPYPCSNGNQCTVETCVVQNGLPTCNSAPSGLCECTQATQATDCNDGNDCTRDLCVYDNSEWTCDNTPEPQGTACSDGDLCTDADACNATGQCIGTAKNCSDGNECTSEMCDPTSGSCTTPVPLSDVPCDDGNICTENTMCVAGACHGPSSSEPRGNIISCDDGNECTDDSCDPSQGGCQYDNNSKPCEDGDLCTANDICSGGTCIAGSGTICDDDNDCTDDGVCNPATGQCPTPTPVSAGTTCSDGLACTGGDQCDGAGLCQGSNLCDDGIACTPNVCSSTTGLCEYPTSACPCSGPADCNDNDPCTRDVCTSSFQCENIPDTTDPCDDGKVCTDNDTCNGAGVCAGTPKSCTQDGNQCDEEKCVEANGTGLCESVPYPTGTPCDDGDVCTTASACDSTTVSCEASAFVTCPAPPPCYVSSGVCDPVSGCEAPTLDPACQSCKGYCGTYPAAGNVPGGCDCLDGCDIDGTCCTDYEAYCAAGPDAL